MCQDKTFRIVIKRTDGVPTIPVSTDHRNGDWISTDIYEGEQAMDVNTGIVYTRSATGIESVGGGGGAVNVYATKTVNIGIWDMDATADVSVAHGVADYTKIRTIEALIINDLASKLMVIDHIDNSTGVTQGSVVSVTATDIGLNRTTSGDFDSADYNDGAMNRGYVTITYEL